MIRASSSRKTISLPLKLNTAAVYESGKNSPVQQRLPSLLDEPIAFAHRGARAHAPENTLEAFALGLKLGATGLESDVWLTADGVPVLDHDGLVKTRFSKRAIGEMRRSQLPSFIPTVAELLDTCGTGYHLSLDLKG